MNLTLALYFALASTLSGVKVEAKAKAYHSGKDASHHSNLDTAPIEDAAGLVKQTQEQPASGGGGISACISMLYGDDINIESIAAWIKFNQLRWNVTHVGIHIREKEYNDVRPRLESAIKDTDVTVHATFQALPNFNDKKERRRFQVKAMTQCLLDAKERGNEYMMNFDPDEYLTSEQYNTIQDMFAFANNKPSIRFPMWVNNYHFCTSRRPTMGSATWQAVLPVGATFDKKNTSKVYTNVLKGKPTNGQRKYIMRTKFFDKVGYPHHPTYNTEKYKDDDELWMFDYTGRKSEMQDAQIIHFRSDVGIQADQDSNVCRWSAPEGCRYVLFNGTCTENMYEADLAYHSTEVQRILDGVPLTTNAFTLYEEATCYAERYPNLNDVFCDGNLTKCDFHALAEHFDKAGQDEHLIFGCRHRQTTTPPMLQKPEVTQIQDVHLLIFESDSESVVLPAKQAAQAGLSFTVFGGGHQFKGFGTKWHILPDILVTMDPNALVLVMDGRDVMLNIPQTDTETIISMAQQLLDSTKKTYEALVMSKPNAVVMSAEGSCCVAALTHASPGDYFDKGLNRMSRACSSGTDNCMWAGDIFRLPWEEVQESLAMNRTGVNAVDVYLNAGLIAGTPQNILDLVSIAAMDESEDDQAVFTDLMYRRPDLIVLDHAQEMFGNNRWWAGMDRGCVYEKNSRGLMAHKETKSNPLVLHTAGKFFDCFSWIASQLELDKEPTMSLSHPSLRTSTRQLNYQYVECSDETAYGVAHSEEGIWCASPKRENNDLCAGYGKTNDWGFGQFMEEFDEGDYLKYIMWAGCSTQKPPGSPCTNVGYVVLKDGRVIESEVAEGWEVTNEHIEISRPSSCDKNGFRKGYNPDGNHELCCRQSRPPGKFSVASGNSACSDHKSCCIAVHWEVKSRGCKDHKVLRL